MQSHQDQENQSLISDTTIMNNCVVSDNSVYKSSLKKAGVKLQEQPQVFKQVNSDSVTVLKDRTSEKVNSQKADQQQHLQHQLQQPEQEISSSSQSMTAAQQLQQIQDQIGEKDLEIAKLKNDLTEKQEELEKANSQRIENELQSKEKIWGLYREISGLEDKIHEKNLEMQGKEKAHEAEVSKLKKRVAELRKNQDKTEKSQTENCQNVVAQPDQLDAKKALKAELETLRKKNDLLEKQLSDGQQVKSSQICQLEKALYEQIDVTNDLENTRDELMATLKKENRGKAMVMLFALLLFIFTILVQCTNFESRNDQHLDLLSL